MNVSTETEEVFIGELRTDCSHAFSGMQVRNEYLKTHWERVQEWQDVTGELEVSNDGQQLRQPFMSTLKIATVYVTDKNYRFVKVDGYMISKEIAKSIWSLGYLSEQIQQCDTTLLRVERKDEP